MLLCVVPVLPLCYNIGLKRITVDGLKGFSAALARSSSITTADLYGLIMCLSLVVAYLVPSFSRIDVTDIRCCDEDLMDLIEDLMEVHVFHVM